MSGHCNDVEGDRSLGAYWEREFCKMMAAKGKMFTPLQIGRQSSAVAHWQDNGEWKLLTLPDVTIWTAPGEHHEIKHKTTTKSGRFGLEQYRLDALVRFAEETKQDVRYTIHDHRGNRDSRSNNVSDWISASVMRLLTATVHVKETDSYVGGQKKRVPCCYWKKQLFDSLFNE